MDTERNGVTGMKEAMGREYYQFCWAEDRSLASSTSSLGNIVQDNNQNRLPLPPDVELKQFETGKGKLEWCNEDFLLTGDIKQTTQTAGGQESPPSEKRTTNTVGFKKRLELPIADIIIAEAVAEPKVNQDMEPFIGHRRRGLNLPRVCPRGAKQRALCITLSVSIGIVILALIIWAALKAVHKQNMSGSGTSNNTQALYNAS